MALSLADLVRPLDVERFLAEVWDQRPWHGVGTVGRPAAEQLLSLSMLERIIATLYRPEDGWLQLARIGRRALPPRMVGEDGLISLPDLYGAFARGETLYLTKAERLAPSLMQLCRTMEIQLLGLGLALRQPINAHVFLTPPGSQGFPAHRDEHASLVVQVEGSKRWLVYDRSTERAASSAAPLRPGTVDPGALGAEVSSFPLEVGDVLYVPEGWAHEAVAQDSHSLHVTFRIFSLRWSDVLNALSSRHAGLAAPLPRHALADVPALTHSLASLIDDHRFRAPLAPLLQQLAREHAVPGRVLPEDGLRQVLLAGTLNLDTPLVRRAGVSCHVFMDDEKVGIAFPGGAIRAPAIMAQVFRYVAATPRLRARDLPPLQPAGCYDRLDVARQLVRDGLLRIEHPANAGAQA
jgi:ribosomal protein L16 Arg81 hydroxylase